MANVTRSEDPSWSAETLLAAVTSGFASAREPRLVRQRFQEELRVLVDAREAETLSRQRPLPPWYSFLKR